MVETTKFTFFKASLRNYSSFFSWFFFDSVWKNKYLSMIILATGFLGVTFQIQVFGLIIYYSRHFSSGKAISLAGYTYDPRTSMGLLSAGSLAVFLLLILSSFCIYFSRRSILQIGRKYEEYCAKRIFYLLGMNTDVFSSASLEIKEEAYLLRLVKGDSRMAGRVLRMLLSLIVPFITLLVSFFVLFYLEFAFTLCIIFSGLVFLFCQYKVSTIAVTNSVRFEQLALPVSKEYRTVIQHCKQQSHDNENRTWVEKLFSRGPVKQQMDAFEGRLRATENSRFISGVFMAVIISSVILVMGGSIIRDAYGWGRLLVYVVALRFAMNNLQAIFTILTGINRFYPQLRRYYYFVQSFAQTEQKQHMPLDEYQVYLPNKTGTEILENASGRLTLNPGKTLALITSLELNRYSLADIIRGMLGDNETAVKGALSSMRFATSAHSCPDCSLRQLLQLPEAAGWKDIRLPQRIISRLKEALPGNLDKPLKQGIWETIDPDLKFMLSFLSALYSDCQWVILEEKGMTFMDQEAFSFFQSDLRNKICVIVFNANLSQAGNYTEDAVAVLEDGALIGSGSSEWFSGVQEEVQERLRLTGRKKTSSLNETEDEDELDEF